MLCTLPIFIQQQAMRERVAYGGLSREPVVAANRSTPNVKYSPEPSGGNAGPVTCVIVSHNEAQVFFCMEKI